MLTHFSRIELLFLTKVLKFKFKQKRLYLECLLYTVYVSFFYIKYEYIINYNKLILVILLVRFLLNFCFKIIIEKNL